MKLILQKDAGMSDSARLRLRTNIPIKDIF